LHRSLRRSVGQQYLLYTVESGQHRSVERADPADARYSDSHPAIPSSVTVP
jgi:hypothetical protein